MTSRPTPIGPHVFVEPIHDNESSGGILLGASPRHPTSGFIYSVGGRCGEDLQEGDFVVFEEHGFSQGDVRHDTFFIRCRDENGVHIIRADIDAEPVVRQYLEKYRRTKEDHRIVVKDIDRDNEEVSLMARDIEDIALGLFTETGYGVSYRHHLLIPRYFIGLDFDIMIVPEREIMFSIAEADLENVDV